MPDGESSFREKYKFTSAETESLQKLFFNLQSSISAIESLPSKTRTKLLEKLEEIILHFESEMENLDVFWSFIGRAEIALRVYGRNIIPDDLIKLLKIIWEVQCRVEGKSPNSLPPVIL